MKRIGKVFRMPDGQVLMAEGQMVALYESSREGDFATVPEVGDLVRTDDGRRWMIFDDSDLSVEMKKAHRVVGSSEWRVLEVNGEENERPDFVDEHESPEGDGWSRSDAFDYVEAVGYVPDHLIK